MALAWTYLLVGAGGFAAGAVYTWMVIMRTVRITLRVRDEGDVRPAGKRGPAIPPEAGEYLMTEEEEERMRRKYNGE